MPLNAIREFLKLEASAGIVLVLAAVVALLLANSPLAPVYDLLLDLPVAVQVGSFVLAKPLLLWINDGLMAIFFLLVGLEIKREVLEGELASLRVAVLPGLAAVGGMAVPAAIYVALNAAHPENLAGWAIPTATDIAFALGVLALLGSRVPLGIKVFLTALAIIDDLGAIIIIAAFYTTDLSAEALAVAGFALAGLLVLNRLGVTHKAAYILLGVMLWVSVLKSGVHATLAGVALALTIPLRTVDDEGRSPLRHLEHMLHPWVAFGVVPLFAFANAGVSFAGMTVGALFHPVSLGIAAGLFVGKQVGVLGATWLAVRMGFGSLPEGASWVHVYGAALLAGIGFTMSLFIAALAFPAEMAAATRIGVLTGSLISAFAGYFLLRYAPARRVAGAGAWP